MKKLIVPFVTIFLIACGPSFVWVKEGATKEGFEKDVLQCKYEASVATSSYSTGRIAGSTYGAISQGIAEGIAVGTRKNELIQLCLQAKGYTKDYSGPHRSNDNLSSSNRAIDKNDSVLNSMECQTSSDCGEGESCRSKGGGGTECRLRVKGSENRSGGIKYDVNGGKEP